MLCRGLEDSAIQLDLLSDKNHDMTPEQILRLIEAREAEKRLATQLLLPHATDGVTGSTYIQASEERCRGGDEGPLPKEQDPFSYCGKRVTVEMLPPAWLRHNECPAYGTVCGRCNKHQCLQGESQDQIKQN